MRGVGVSLGGFSSEQPLIDVRGSVTQVLWVRSGHEASARGHGSLRISCVIHRACARGALSLCRFKGRDTSQILRVSEEHLGASETGAPLQPCPSEPLGRALNSSFLKLPRGFGF